MTAVLPQMSAGKSFQAGMATGKFQGVMMPDHADRPADRHRELVGHLRRHGLAEQAPALAGHVVGDVDRLLHVAARLGQDLAHLARHEPGELLLVLGQEARDAEQDLAALRRGHGAPCRECAPCAASTAASTSAGPEAGNSPMTSSRLAGLTLVKVAPDSAGFQSAPIRFWYDFVTEMDLLGARERGAWTRAGARF